MIWWPTLTCIVILNSTLTYAVVLSSRKLGEGRSKKLWCYTCYETDVESCNVKLKLASCRDWENECVNMSFSYMEKNESRFKTIFERKCAYRNKYLGNCSHFHCSTPRQFNSSDCNAECCDSDVCNGEAQPINGSITLVPDILMLLSVIYLWFSIG